MATWYFHLITVNEKARKEEFIKPHMAGSRSPSLVSQSLLSMAIGVAAFMNIEKCASDLELAYISRNEFLSW